MHLDLVSGVALFWWFLILTFLVVGRLLVRVGVIYESLVRFKEIDHKLSKNDRRSAALGTRQKGESELPMSF